MGVLRGSGVVIVSVLLFISLLVLGISASMTLSLNYENVNPKIHFVAQEIIKDQIGEQTIVDKLIPYLDEFCDTNTEIVHDFEGYTFVYPCSVVQEGYDSIVNYSVEYLVSDFYYKEYDCSFTKCFEESTIPLFLVSNYARQFWNSFFIKALIIALVLSGFIILIMEKRINSSLLIGSLVVGSSLIILISEKVGILVAKVILSPLSMAFSEGNSNEILSKVVAMFFSESSYIFLWMFIIGLVLIGLWIIFSLTGIGFKIKEKIDSMKGNGSDGEKVSKSDVRKIVKEEMSGKNSSKQGKRF